MNLPTREELNVDDSLDERCACQHFIGKTLEQAEALFCENFLYYQEDLSHMGPLAFRFYVPAAVKYIQSDAALGDSDAINCFIGMLELRWNHERKDLLPMVQQLSSACTFVLENYSRFDVNEEIYGDLCVRYTMIRALFQNPPKSIILGPPA